MSLVMLISGVAIVGTAAAAAMCWAVTEILPAPQRKVRD